MIDDMKNAGRLLSSYACSMSAKHVTDDSSFVPSLLCISFLSPHFTPSSLHFVMSATVNTTFCRPGQSHSPQFFLIAREILRVADRAITQ
jgi:hypothetical protein